MASLFVPLSLALLFVGGAVFATVALRVRDLLGARDYDPKRDARAQGEDEDEG